MELLRFKQDKSRFHQQKLLGGLEHVDHFSTVGNVIMPTDEVHHFSEG